MGKFRSWLLDVGLLVLRLSFGLMMAGFHGASKLAPEHVAMMAKMGVEPMGFPCPMLFAYLNALTESLAALFVAAGCLTRLSCLPLMFNMGVALFGVHIRMHDPVARMEPALSYLAVWTVILLAGPGRYSVDRWLFPRKD